MKERQLVFDRRSNHQHHLGQPKHELVRDSLVSQILAGRLKPGQALPSLRSLEEQFGVARMTICQAMNSLENDGLIRRVQGKGTYVEGDARSKLRQGQDVFALIVPETSGSLYHSLLQGFESAAGDIRHQMILCSTDDDVAKQADVILQLLDKDIGGVAIVPTTQVLTPAYQIRHLQKQNVPVVFCHRGVDGVSAPALTIPFREVGRLAGQTLAERGHRHAVFLVTHHCAAGEAYKAGFCDVMQAGDIQGDVETVYLGDSFVAKEERVFDALQQVFSKPNPPTAIFASADSLVEMIYLLLPRLGVRVPEDVSLIGFGGALREGALIRRLSSVVIDENAMGRRAVEILHEMRSGVRPIDDNEEIALPLSFSEGETLASPGKSNQA